MLRLVEVLLSSRLLGYTGFSFLRIWVVLPRLPDGVLAALERALPNVKVSQASAAWSDYNTRR